MDEQKVLADAVETYGAENQLWVFVGECGELVDAMSDYRRGRCDVDHVAEEIADVEIMLDQLMIIYQCRDAVKAWRRKKLKRLWLRLKGGGV